MSIKRNFNEAFDRAEDLLDSISDNYLLLVEREDGGVSVSKKLYSDDEADEEERFMGDILALLLDPKDGKRPNQAEMNKAYVYLVTMLASTITFGAEDKLGFLDLIPSEDDDYEEEEDLSYNIVDMTKMPKEDKEELRELLQRLEELSKCACSGKCKKGRK